MTRVMTVMKEGVRITGRKDGGMKRSRTVWRKGGMKGCQKQKKEQSRV